MKGTVLAAKVVEKQGKGTVSREVRLVGRLALHPLRQRARPALKARKERRCLRHERSWNTRQRQCLSYERSWSTGQRQCLSHERSWSTRQRQCRTTKITISAAFAAATAGAKWVALTQRQLTGHGPPLH